MTESIVNVPSIAAGVPIDVISIVNPATGQTVERQVIAIGDPDTPGAFAQTDGNGNLSVNETNAASATSPDKPYFVVLTGDPAGDFAQMNLLEEMLKDNAGLTIGVQVQNQPKTDAAGRLIISDGVQINVPPLPVGASFIIDTTGYQSFNITTQALVGSVQYSNDLLTWATLLLVVPASGNLTGALAASTSYSARCDARWLRIVPTTAGTASIYLRSSPGATSIASGTSSVNVTQLSSSAIGTVPGGTGIMPVGGSTAAGGSAATAPVEVGGVDSGGLVRRLLQDTSGRVIDTPYSPDATGTSRQLSSVPVLPGAIAALLTQDTQTTDGSTIADLLWQMVLEQKITNHLLHVLVTQGGSPNVEEPATLRNDPTLFLPN